MKRVEAFGRYSCEEHGFENSMGVCPWPNCSNGVSEDEFELDRSLPGINAAGEKIEIFSRREWSSQYGVKYYSWERAELPNWFGINETIWSEARRLNVIEPVHYETIYHYTSLEGVKGIVENDSIWLTDYAFLNDSSELNYGIHLILEAISELENIHELDEARSVFSSWKKQVNSVKQRICIASFSTDGDSLSQWRAYGDLCIGFDTNFPIGGANETTYQPVIYDAVKQKKILKIMLWHLASAFIVDSKSGKLERLEDVYHKTEKLLGLIAYFKDQRFSDESEYRIAYFEDKDLFDSIGASCAPKRFRISAGKFVPYVTSKDIKNRFDDGEIKIKSLTLGPGVNEMLESGLREFLDYNGHRNIPIYKSSVPFRS